MTKKQALMIWFTLTTVGAAVYGTVSHDWSGVPVGLAALYGTAVKA